jgi:hypothetical protein
MAGTALAGDGGVVEKVRSAPRLLPFAFVATSL